jgi:hypothetical protein
MGATPPSSLPPSGGAAAVAVEAIELSSVVASKLRQFEQRASWLLVIQLRTCGPNSSSASIQPG